MPRNPSPYQRFKRNFARVIYGRKSNCLTADELRHMKALFRHFPECQHDALALYPDWLEANWAEIERLEERRLRDPETPPYFLFSKLRIARYLSQLERLDPGS